MRNTWTQKGKVYASQLSTSNVYSKVNVMFYDIQGFLNINSGKLVNDCLQVGQENSRSIYPAKYYNLTYIEL